MLFIQLQSTNQTITINAINQSIIHSFLSIPSRSLSSLLFFITTFKQTTRLGVEVFVSRIYNQQQKIIYIYSNLNNIPLNSPAHNSISNDKWRNNVESLVLASAEGVEEGSLKGTSQRSLSIGREGVGCDSLRSRAAYINSEKKGQSSFS